MVTVKMSFSAVLWLLKAKAPGLSLLILQVVKNKQYILLTYTGVHHNKQEYKRRNVIEPG